MDTWHREQDMDQTWGTAIAKVHFELSLLLFQFLKLKGWILLKLAICWLRAGFHKIAPITPEFGEAIETIWLIFPIDSEIELDMVGPGPETTLFELFSNQNGSSYWKRAPSGLLWYYVAIEQWKLFKLENIGARWGKIKISALRFFTEKMRKNCAVVMAVCPIADSGFPF